MADTDNDIESIMVNGAGPVGALLAVMLARRGYQIDLFESRPDSRKTSIYQGKSINLALSDRGWKALKSVGIEEAIKEHAIPMHCRIMHDIDGNISQQPYGQKGQAIWSVSRSGINEQLIAIAEQEKNINIHFNKRLTQLDFDNSTAVFLDENHHQYIHQSDLVFGADGTFSKVRRLAQELPKQRTSYSVDYMPQSYIELNIPANEDGSHKLEKNALHIWPRKDFMLIALPNPDGSFTCTLFMDQEGELSFDSLMSDKQHNKEQAVYSFFHYYFADVYPILENPIEQFLSKPASSLCLVHIFPWVFNQQVTLIGDAAHAMVPFYGQGLNCGFEDCRILDELVAKNSHQWPKILNEYQTQRKINSDAITELAKRNFIEMSELSGSPKFLLRKEIEAEFNRRYPELWIPLYSMVTFSPDIPYSTALNTGDVQKEIMDEVMQIPNIEETWRSDEVIKTIYSLAKAKLHSVKEDK